jgi:hypothetical protein
MWVEAFAPSGIRRRFRADIRGFAGKIEPETHFSQARFVPGVIKRPKRHDT